jgi:hypothetical protein
MIKKGLKLAVIALAAVAGLGFGFTLAAKVVTSPAASKLSQSARDWIKGFVSFATALAAAVIASKLAAKFGLKGGPSVTVSKG